MTSRPDMPERLQLLWLAVAVVAGVLAGSTFPGDGDAFELSGLPVLTVLLYATFLQIHVRALPAALRERRFLAASLLGNFVLAPALVWLLLSLIPVQPAIRVGVVLVLTAPCTDWFVSFTHLGRGDTRLAVAATPLMLGAQLLLVPLYLWLLTELGPGAWSLGPVLRAFLFVILLPLVTAGITQRVSGSHVVRAAADRAIVPLLAATLFLVTASQALAVRDAGGELLRALAIFACYLLAVPLIARVLAGRARLATPAARTLAFNLGTRNSFVVLPLALSLSGAYALAAPVIAAQTLVELTGMLAYLRWVPARLFPDRNRAPGAGGESPRGHG